MIAAPINPSDLMSVRGTYGQSPALPNTPGFEGVGVVESGSGMLARLLKGKRVAVLNRSCGVWSDYAVVPAKQAIPVSSEISDEQAAAFFINPATAWLITQAVLKVRPGEWLVQTAAASTLGKMVVRLGREIGFRTLNIVRREEQAEALKAQGADEVLVFDEATDPIEFAARARSVVPGGVRCAMDPVGGKIGSAVARCLGKDGQLVVYGTLADEPLSLHSRDLMTNAARLEGFWLSNYLQSIRLPAKIRLVRRLNDLVRRGILAADIGATFPLERFAGAVSAAESGRGKVILSIRPTET